MDNFRDIMGYISGIVFCLGGMVLCYLAWLGLSDEFGWRWALAGIGVCLLIRVNIPLLVGLVYFAHNIWGWPLPESVGFAIPGVLFLLPSIATDLFSFLVGTTARP